MLKTRHMMVSFRKITSRFVLVREVEPFRLFSDVEASPTAPATAPGRVELLSHSALPLRSSGWAVLASGEAEIVRRLFRMPISWISSARVLLHVHPRTHAEAGQK